ncbi:hypothetical protein BV22DRAFT_1135315 [Leucogyrophana mollusca]|uniref:Uncharacterized protein n=1 Tax=Leucogyrophana mollusca TaxID=85980 RepID=A0ACB8AXF2_9AGAM|nr:hypothetical protein BV22DRAFT_1135315 [Leucogyrophana mollusca]
MNSDSKTPVSPTRHNRYYFDDGSIVDNKLYKLYAIILCQKSQFFNTMLSLALSAASPQSEKSAEMLARMKATGQDGTDNNHPLIIPRDLHG